MRQTHTSTAAGRRAWALDSLPPRPRARHLLTLRRDDQTLEVAVSVVSRWALPWTAASATPEAWLQTRFLSPDVACIRVPSWLPQSAEHTFEKIGAEAHAKFWTQAIDKALTPLRDIPDLIIDVRGNAGGSDRLSLWFASHFMRAPMRPYVLRFRAPADKTGSPDAPDGYYNPGSIPANYPGQRGPLSSARLWVLVDERSASATDTFLHTLRTGLGPRVTLIGRPSNGGIGAPAVIGSLRHSGAQLTASTCKAFALDGSLLEGNPTPIDHLVRWTRADLLEGRDPDLEQALRLIAAQ